MPSGVYIRTPKIRSIISDGQKKRFENPEASNKMREIAKKAWENLEYRSKMSISHKGYKHSDETRDKLKEAAKKRFENPEERKKISESSKKMWRNPKIRATMTASRVGRKWSVESRSKVSASKMGHEVNKETRDKIGAAHTGRKHSVETRTKMSEGNKKHRELCEDTECGMCANVNPSKFAWDVYVLLLAPKKHLFQAEARVGRKFIDFLDLDEWIAYECDGEYWHKDRDHTERDEYLLREFDLPTVRIPEKWFREFEKSLK